MKPAPSPYAKPWTRSLGVQFRVFCDRSLHRSSTLVAQTGRCRSSVPGRCGTLWRTHCASLHPLTLSFFCLLTLGLSACAHSKVWPNVHRAQPEAPTVKSSRSIDAPATAVTAGLQWNDNPEPDIAGYRLWWGFVPGVHPKRSGVLLTSPFTRVRIFNFPIYYIVRAYSRAGLESGDSNEVHVP